MNDNRSQRESDIYNSDDLKRDQYDSLFSQTRSYYFDYVKNLMREKALFAEGKDILELGSQSWYLLIWNNGIRPKSLTCINISQAELKKGIKRSHETDLNIDLKVMDAHNLEFQDRSFDFIFGGGILHHLDIEQACREICRVLKDDGKILFHEPLSANPVAKIVRLLTPSARTKDEKPIGYRQLRILNEYFECENHYEQFLSVPLGMVSNVLFKEQRNKLTKTAFGIDRQIEQSLPPARLLFRHIIISGTKKQ